MADMNDQELREKRFEAYHKRSDVLMEMIGRSLERLTQPMRPVEHKREGAISVLVNQIVRLERAMFEDSKLAASQVLEAQRDLLYQALEQLDGSNDPAEIQKARQISATARPIIAAARRGKVVESASTKR